MGLGFLIALVTIGAFRELLAAAPSPGSRWRRGRPLLFFALPAGASSRSGC